MDLIRRIGTVRHRWKVQIFMDKVSLSKQWPGNLYVSVRRGNHKRNTTQQIPIDSQLECNFQKQILTFEALTLFYDEDEQLYLEKPGQMKLILRANSGDKKLLGIVGFDVAELPNTRSRTEQHFKKPLTETPNNLTGSISYQMYVKYLGEGGQSAISSDHPALTNTLTAMKGSKQEQIIRPDQVEVRPLTPPNQPESDIAVNSAIFGMVPEYQKKPSQSNGSNVQSSVREYYSPQVLKMTEEEELFPQNTTQPYTAHPTSRTNKWEQTYEERPSQQQLVTETATKRDSGKNKKKVKQTTLGISPNLKKHHISAPTEPTLPIILDPVLTPRQSEPERGKTEPRGTQRRESRVTSVSKPEDYLDDQLDDMFGPQPGTNQPKDPSPVVSPIPSPSLDMKKPKIKQNKMSTAQVIVPTPVIVEERERESYIGQLKELRQVVKANKNEHVELQKSKEEISTLKNQLSAVKNDYARMKSELEMLKVQNAQLNRLSQLGKEDRVSATVGDEYTLLELRRAEKERNQLLVIVDQLKTQQAARIKQARESQARVVEEQSEEQQRLKAELLRCKEDLRGQKEQVKRWIKSDEEAKDENVQLMTKVHRLEQESLGLQQQLSQLKINMGEMMNALSEQGRHSVVMALTNLSQQ